MRFHDDVVDVEVIRVCTKGETKFVCDILLPFAPFVGLELSLENNEYGVIRRVHFNVLAEKFTIYIE